MKIDQNRANLDTLRNVGADAVRDEKAAAAGKATHDPRHADQVKLSSTGQLAAAAAQAANDAPEVRPDAVARGKALLESGTLGSDPARLADAMIDSLLDQ
jgi:flagellar biosynthesis anti-sigma factor FlgM